MMTRFTRGLCMLVALAGCGGDNRTVLDARLFDRTPNEVSPAEAALPQDLVAGKEARTTDRPLTSPPYLRAFDALDGAVLTVCVNKNPFAPRLDRVGSGPVVAGYTAVADAGPLQIWSEPHTGGTCKDTVPASSKLSLSPQPGSYHTLVVRSVTLTPVFAVADDLLSAPAPGGKARLRLVNASRQQLAASLDLCLDQSPLATGVSRASGGAYADLAPGTQKVTLREQAGAACGGAALGSAEVALLAGRAATLFAFDAASGTTGKVSLCQDADASGPLSPSTCADLPLGN